MNHFPFLHCVTLCIVYRTRAVQAGQWQMSLFFPPNRETSVVPVVGRILRGQITLSVSFASPFGPCSPPGLGMDRTVSNVCVLLVVQKVAFYYRLSIVSSASFEEPKKIKKEKCSYCLSLPPLTRPQGQPHYTVMRSEVIQYKVETKTLFSEKHKRLAERSGGGGGGDSRFRRIPSRDQRRLCTGRSLRGSTIRHRSKHTDTHTLLFFHSSNWCRWSQPWNIWKFGLRQEGQGYTDGWDCKGSQAVSTISQPSTTGDKVRRMCRATIFFQALFNNWANPSGEGHEM